MDNTTRVNANPQFTNQPINRTNQTGPTNIMPGPAPQPPMNPTKKKKLITVIILILAGIILVTAGIVAFILLNKVDYSTSYQTAKELNSVIYYIQSSNCTNIVEDVGSEYTSDTSYNTYISTCLNAVRDINQYSNELRETAGVKKNKEIKAHFDRYWELKESTIPSTDEFEAKTKLYSAWHSFVYNVEKTSAKTASDADLQHLANYLIDSGNDRLKKYGEGWLEKTIAYVHAYQEYSKAGYSNPNYSQLRQTKDNLQSERETWITAHRPNITELASLDFSKSKQLTNTFSELYDLIKENYEANYQSSNDDCIELFGEVICD